MHLSALDVVMLPRMFAGERGSHMLHCKLPRTWAILDHLMDKSKVSVNVSSESVIRSMKAWQPFGWMARDSPLTFQSTLVTLSTLLEFLLHQVKMGAFHFDDQDDMLASPVAGMIFRLYHLLQTRVRLVTLTQWVAPCPSSSVSVFKLFEVDRFSLDICLRPTSYPSLN